MARTKQTCRMSTNGGVRRAAPQRVNVDLTSGSGTESDSQSRENRRRRLLVDQAVDVASSLLQQRQQQVLLV